MSDRHTIKLTPSNREKALQGVEVALAKYRKGEAAWTMELRPAKRTDDQNRALWSLLSQVQKQRPMHRGVQMTPETWKAVFLQALGAEMVFVPTLDGDGMFPLGHRSSKLTKAEFAGLLELIMAWCAREGLTINHFNGEEAGATEEAPSRAA